MLFARTRISVMGQLMICQHKQIMLPDRTSKTMIPPVEVPTSARCFYCFSIDKNTTDWRFPVFLAVISACQFSRVIRVFKRQNCREDLQTTANSKAPRVTLFQRTAWKICFSSRVLPETNLPEASSQIFTRVAPCRLEVVYQGWICNVVTVRR